MPVLKAIGSFSTTLFFKVSFLSTGSAFSLSVTSGAFFFLDLVFLASAGAATGASLALLDRAGGVAFFGAGAFFSFLALGFFSVLSIQVS